MTPLTSSAHAEVLSALRRMGVGLAAAFLLSMLPASVSAQDADPVMARVNGVEIHESDLKLAEEDIGANMPSVPPEAKRDYLVSYMADVILGAQAAEKQKLHETAHYKSRSAFVLKKLLMGQLLQLEAKAAATETAMHEVYKDAIKQIGEKQEVHARHILFRIADAKDEKASKAAEDKVKAVIERLKKGEDFAKLANELTEDPSGKKSGGDLGYFTKDQMVPEFAKVAFKLEKGQISEPVKTDFGWHVIKVEDKRTKPPPTYDAVKDQIEKFVVQRAQSALIKKLRQEAKIEKLYKTAAPKPDASKTDAKPDAKTDAKPAEPAKK